MSESSNVMATESFRGFHFTFSRTFNVSSCQACNLHLSYKLPPQVFPDPYELQLDSLLSCTFSSQPNLELPDAVLGEEGTEFSCQLPISPIVAAKGNITVAIPLHVRYGLPLSATRSMRPVHVTAPLADCHCLSTEGFSYLTGHIQLLIFHFGDRSNINVSTRQIHHRSYFPRRGIWRYLFCGGCSPRHCDDRSIISASRFQENVEKM